MMGFNGGQKEQYCPYCQAPLGYNGNSRKTCLDCHQPGCLVCLTPVNKGDRVTCHFHHFNCQKVPAQIARHSKALFVKAIKCVGNLAKRKNGQWSMDTNSVNRLIGSMILRFSDLFDLVSKGKGEPRYGLYLEKGLPFEIRLTMINGSGKPGPVYSFDVRDYSDPSIMARKILDKML